MNQFSSSVYQTQISSVKPAKKLCERWLDNLILILFEDLRIFLYSHGEELKQQVKVVQQGVKEWYLLGRLARRLGHLEESKLVYKSVYLVVVVVVVVVKIL